MSVRARYWVAGVVVAIVALAVILLVRERPFRVGSKKFTESVILGEMLRALVAEQIPVEHIHDLGGTRIVFEALRTGEIDAYVEYTGTIQQEILAGRDATSRASMAEQLARMGVRLGPALGFNNTYALGMRKDAAKRLGITRLSDLRDHPDLRFGLTHEFLERDDGWKGLRRRYGLPQGQVSGLDHDIAYRAIAAGDVDVIDLYSTDAKIRTLGLVALKDDLGYFPRYEAVILYRTALEKQEPSIVEAFGLLAGRIDEEQMVAMNAAVDADGRDEGVVAAAFLEKVLGRPLRAKGEPAGPETWYQRVFKRTVEQVTLVATSLVIAILLGITLGVVAAKTGARGQGIIAVVSAVQTFPGLALLVLFVPIFGIGKEPTIIALTLYSLLPIVRNTYAGITTIPRPIRESALALALPPSMRLTQVELPLAAPSILAGVQTAAVWNVGLSILGGLIGAGGYGLTIMVGLRKFDDGLILEGAIPAILLALAVQGLFDVLGRAVISPGLRYGPDRKAG